MAKKPWNGWFHCMGNTYGTWLPGDPRGFRTRHHREHVDGDYKHPPPAGRYGEQYERSKRLMKRDAVLFTPDLRPIVCRLLGEALIFHGVELVDLSVSSMHFHLLARFTNCQSPPAPAGGAPQPEGCGVSAYDIDPLPRTILGRARSYVTRQLKQKGYFRDRRGGLWAKRPKIESVENRQHQVNLAGYIRQHVEQGAAVWTLVRQSHD